MSASQSLKAAESKPLSSDIQAEQSVIGAILIDPKSANEIAGRLFPDDFHSDAHKAMYETLLEMSLAGASIDIITVKNELGKKGTLEMCGGWEYLHTVMASVPSSANITYYAEIVKDKSLRRSFYLGLSEVATMSQNDADMFSLIDTAENLLFRLAERKQTGKAVGFNDLLLSGFEDLENIKEGKAKAIKLGFAAVDNMLAGIYPGDFIIIGARPAVGKTAFALNLSVNIAQQKVPVCVFSLEMSKEQLIQRIYCAYSLVDSYQLRQGNLHPEDWGKLSNAQQNLYGLPILIDDTPSIGVIEMKSKARRFFAKHGKPGVVVIDYLQLMQSAKRTENRQVEVADISRGLKIFAKEVGCPVVALSQLSRATEARADKIPQLSDLRESGSQEQDTDIVMFLHRLVAEMDAEKRADTKVFIAKHRTGPTGIVDLYYNEHYTRFTDVNKYGLK